MPTKKKSIKHRKRDVGHRHAHTANPKGKTSARSRTLAVKKAKARKAVSRAKKTAKVKRNA